ncbi:MAG: response regulator [Gemmatimonadota bacterium]|nr:response regulator [Gemmatimonadota bacterium]
MGQRILLVDDESAILFAYTRVLERQNLEVDAVGSVRETLGLLEKNEYKVAILDLRLGGDSCEDGFELLELIRKRQPGTKIIIITAYGSQEIQEKAFDLGANYYFEKPVSTRVIQDALKASGVPIPENNNSNMEWKFQ